MPSFAGEITIDRPIESVFDVVADERNEPDYNPAMLQVHKLTDGPIGVGTRFKAVHAARRRPIEMIVEFTDYDRPRRIGSVTTMSWGQVRGALTFDTVCDRTRMRWTWTIHPTGVARVLGPMVTAIGRRAERACWEGLKQDLEADREISVGAYHRNQRRRRVEPIRTRIEHELDTRSAGLAVALLRLTRGRIARPWHRDVLILTTTGRRSGKPRAVPLQYFADGDDLIVAAANSGLNSPPGWYLNLTSNPTARVEVRDHTLLVRAEELPAAEAATFWPRVLNTAPDYVRYPRRSGRPIPLMRLTPATPTIRSASGMTRGVAP